MTQFIFFGVRSSEARRWESGHTVQSLRVNTWPTHRVIGQGLNIPYDTAVPKRLVIPDSVVPYFDLIAFGIDGVEQIEKYNLSSRSDDYVFKDDAAPLNIDTFKPESKVGLVVRRTKHDPDHPVHFRASLSCEVKHTVDQLRSEQHLDEALKQAQASSKCVRVEAPFIPEGWICSGCMTYNPKLADRCGACTHDCCANR